MTEKSYLDLLVQCARGDLTQPPDETPRYGVHGCLLRFSLLNNAIPIMTTKRVAYITAFREMFWFMSGEKSLAKLKEQGVHIWDMWDQGGDKGAGPLYGYQMRHWKDYKGGEIDQLQVLIDTFKKNPYSASLKINMWRPDMLSEMMIKPCHTDFQLNTYNIGGSLFGSGHISIRSWDVAVGGPFNIAQYAMFTHLLCFHLGIRPREFVLTASNAHVYKPHLDGIKIQVGRTPYPFPKISFKERKSSIDDYTVDDIVITDYQSYPAIPFELVAAGKPARAKAENNKRG